MGGTAGPRVLVDATAVPADRGGVGRYVDQLLPELGALGADLVVACQQRDGEHYARLVPTAEVVLAPAAIARTAVRLAWEQIGLPRLAARTGARVLHCPHYTMPLRAGLPVVTTLHDATFFTHPEVHLPVKRVFFTAWTRASLRLADRCVVPSRATLDELRAGDRRRCAARWTWPTTASTRRTSTRPPRRTAVRPTPISGCGHRGTSPSSARSSRARTCRP